MTNASVQFDFIQAEVLITGGTSGIGYATATAFNKAGAVVHITGTRSSANDYTVDLSDFIYHQLEATDKMAINTLAASLSHLDILINNAGASFPDGKNEWDPDVFAQALDINLMSAFRLSTACKALLENSNIIGGASIVNIASLSGVMAVDLVPGYGTAKAGIIQMTKNLGLSWAKLGIRTNAIAPGLIQTRMTEGFADNPEFCKPILKRTPLKRTGTAEEIAQVILFLCSSGASFIVGETIMVDGGYSVVG
jgi:NAD(P)-dependent dehydrogenase (short-subunit alcohol dehydrogenase family)